jgi:hypothetical protein
VSEPLHPLAQAARREVIALHEVFEAWLGGALPPSDDLFERVEASLAPSFTMVPPDGKALSRADVIAAIRTGYGAKGREGAFRIAIAEFETLHVAPPLVAVRYMEVQQQGQGTSRRRSTALLQASARSESGMEWLVLHETWMTPAT